MSNDVLLTVSGVVPHDLRARIMRGERPRADYLELARSFNADMIDYASAHVVAGSIGRVLERIGGNELVLAWACFKLRHRYRAIVTDGEQIGLPLAALLKLTPGKRPRHLMIVHVLSVPKKMLFLDRIGVQSHIDRFLVYSRWQKRFIEQRWHLPDERVYFTPFMVDGSFFAPEQVSAATRARPLICAVGLERRDYPTLLKAVSDLAVDVVVAAASPWSKRIDTTQGQAIPANVTVQKFSQYDLRQLYADSAFLVMPLENVDFQAGVTAILEAMAMGKAVICTQTPGQADIIEDGEHGLYVRPNDPGALRDAIQYLLDRPDEAARMGACGRRLIAQSIGLEHYVARLTEVLRDTIAEAEPSTADGRAISQS